MPRLDQLLLTKANFLDLTQFQLEYLDSDSSFDQAYFLYIYSMDQSSEFIIRL